MIASKKQFKTVDGYIKTFPKEVQSILKKVRQTIRKAAPRAEESISYQMPGYKINGRPLVYFGAWSEHIGFYATPSGNKAFKKEIWKYKGAKGSIRFPLNKPITYSLVRKIVMFRLKENLTKKNI